jgi:hypothetical protein
VLADAPGGRFTLLLTGSQAWTYLQCIATVLKLYICHAFDHGQRLTVIHGDAELGADSLAKMWIARNQRLGWPVDQHLVPADWSGPCRSGVCPPGHRKQRRRDGREYCPMAGIVRNLSMLDLRPRWVEGFVRANSPGSTHCVRQARKRGIATHATTWEQRYEPRLALATVS